MFASRLPRAAAALALVLALPACTSDTPAARRPDSSTTTVAPVAESIPVATAPAVERLGWDASAAGPALFVVGEADRTAQVVLPDADSADADPSLGAAIGQQQLDLFGPGGLVGTATVDPRSVSAPGDRDECDGSATVRLTPAAGARLGTGWSVAFTRGHAQAIALDSLNGMSGADSAKLAVELTRLASSLPPSDSSRAFSGLPFAVRTAYRFTPAGGPETVVATLVRKVNEEANPREEHTLLVAEGGAGTREAAYYDRSSGSEEHVPTTDAIAGVLLGPSRTPTVILERSYDDGVRYALVERIGAHRWRLRWTSAYSGC